MNLPRDLLALIDERVRRVIPQRTIGRAVGEVQAVVPSLRIAQVLLDGATTPVSISYPALPVSAIAAGDKVAVERSRDGWLMVSHVLGRDGDGGSTLPAGSDGDFLTLVSGEPAWTSVAPGSGAPDTVDYLVGTASGGLSAEIVVGTTPGGELGGTWASPTVDATHSGSAHHGQSHDHSAAGDGTALAPATLTVPNTAAPTAARSMGYSSPNLTLGDGATTRYFLPVAATSPSTQAIGDAAAAGSTDAVARIDHKHAMPAFGSSSAAVGTSAAGSASTVAHSDHVHATGAGTPSTQAFADAAATGTGPAAAMTDHKHAMPTLGYGLSGNSAPAVGLSTAQAFATAETTLSTNAYADITGASISLAAGTWLIIGEVHGRSVNARAQMNVAITDGSNTVVREGTADLPASGTASVNSWMTLPLSVIVTPGSTTTYKLRGARGNTTLTNSWIASDGAGVGVANNASSNTDKATGIRAIRVA